MTETFGMRLHNARKAQKLSQEKLANLVGCNWNTIAHYEQDLREKPDLFLVARIAKQLNVTIEYLVWGADYAIAGKR
jgi:transcriptional regulator with XRE-family HTH domain